MYIRYHTKHHTKNKFIIKLHCFSPTAVVKGVDTTLKIHQYKINDFGFANTFMSIIIVIMNHYLFKYHHCSRINIAPEWNTIEANLDLELNFEEMFIKYRTVLNSVYFQVILV